MEMINIFSLTITSYLNNLYHIKHSFSHELSLNYKHIMYCEYTDKLQSLTFLCYTNSRWDILFTIQKGKLCEKQCVHFFSAHFPPPSPVMTYKQKGSGREREETKWGRGKRKEMKGDKGGVNLGSYVKKTLEKINFRFCPTSKVQELQCYHKTRKKKYS